MKEDLYRLAGAALIVWTLMASLSEWSDPLVCVGGFLGGWLIGRADGLSDERRGA